MLSKKFLNTVSCALNYTKYEPGWAGFGSGETISATTISTAIIWLAWLVDSALPLDADFDISIDPCSDGCLEVTASYEGETCREIVVTCDGNNTAVEIWDSKGYWKYSTGKYDPKYIGTAQPIIRWLMDGDFNHLERLT